MASQRCSCGAKYRFRNASIGKQAKCRKCGAIFRLTGRRDDGTIPIADEAIAEEPPPVHSIGTAVPSPPTRQATKICLDCGYILDHLPSNRCPECGRRFDPRHRSSYGRLNTSGLETGRDVHAHRRWLRFLVIIGVAVPSAIAITLLIEAWKVGNTGGFAVLAGYGMIILSAVFHLAFGVVVWIWSVREQGLVWGIASLIVPILGFVMVGLAMRERNATWPLWWFAGFPVAFAGLALVLTSGVQIRLFW